MSVLVPRTQKCVMFSTTEVERVAITDIVKQERFLRQVWRLMSLEVGTPCIPVVEGSDGGYTASAESRNELQFQAH